jgi:hypothetical protein
MINEIMMTKLIIVAILFVGGLSEKIPPTYNIIKNEINPINIVIIEIPSKNHLLFDCGNILSQEFVGSAVKENISLMRIDNRINIGPVINIS